MNTTKIYMNDVTLRDGEQAPGNSMNEKQKLTIARQLAALGISGIEAGFPISSKEEFRSVSLIAQEVGPSVLQDGMHPRISGLARLKREDIAEVLEAVKEAPHRGVHTFISTSPQQLVKFSGKGNIDEFIDKTVLPSIKDNLNFIRDTDPEAVIQFSPEDWTRTSDSVSDRVVLAAAKNGANIINLPDTVGIGIPRLVGQRVQRVRDMLDGEGYEDIIISWHGHNDTGMGNANAFEALYGGARQFETTILGIGERTGNYSFEAFLASLDANKEMHEKIMGLTIHDSITRIETMRTAQLIAQILGIKIPREHPIVGENAFAHESGIHADGQGKGDENGRNDVYEILKPETYGAHSKIIVGKHAGWSNITHVLKTCDVPYRNEDKTMFMGNKEIATANRRKGLSDEEVLQQIYYPTIEEITGGRYIASARDADSINGCKHVELHSKDGKVIRGVASTADQGSIDAIVHGIRQIMPDVNVAPGGFEVHTTGEGSAATAKASFTLKNSHTVTRTAEHENTSAAEQQALISCFNSLYALEQYQKMIDAQKKPE